MLVSAIALGQSPAHTAPDIDTAPRALVEISQRIQQPQAMPASATRSAQPQFTTSTAPLRDSAEDRNFSQRIDFSELAQGSSVSDQYRDRGIIFEGSGPSVASDVYLLVVSAPSHVARGARRGRARKTATAADAEPASAAVVGSAARG